MIFMVFTTYRLRFSLIPLNDIVISSLSSKIVKNILTKCIEEKIYDKYRSFVKFLKPGDVFYKSPVKPIRITFLYKTSSNSIKPLWSEHDSKIILNKDNEYFFDIIIFESEHLNKRFSVSIEPSFVFELLSCMENTHEVYNYARVKIVCNNVDVFNSNDLSNSVNINEPDTVIIDFKTPTLLQYPRHPKLRNTPSRHSLYPQPFLVLLSLIYKWNNIDAKEPITLAHAIFAPYEIIEVGHNIKPITIHLRKIKERGFIGWIKYGIDTRSRKRYENYLKLLKFAEIVGIGRSTSIGFGHVKVTFTKRKTT